MNRNNPTRPRLKAAGLGLMILIISAALLALVPGGLVLSVTPRDRTKAAVELPLAEGERFTIHYYHSVEDSPIWEEHSVDGRGCIYIEEERYLKFGAGLGHIPGRGKLARRGPYEVIEDMHHPLGRFVLRVGALGVDHTIIWRGRRINLSKSLAGRAVVFKAEPISLGRRILLSIKGPLIPVQS